MSSNVVEASHLPTALTQTSSSGAVPIRSLADAIEAAEKDAISAALAANKFHRENTAKILGVRVRTLHYKMSRYGLH